jgi:hypothetical protein
MNKPYYCDYAGVPTIVGETRAWSFVHGAWKEINRTEAYTKARLIGEHEFRQLFGELPPLPPPYTAPLYPRMCCKTILRG